MKGIEELATSPDPDEKADSPTRKAALRAAQMKARADARVLRALLMLDGGGED